MANPCHQWEIGGISVLKELTKGLIPIQMHFIKQKKRPEVRGAFKESRLKLS